MTTNKSKQPLQSMSWSHDREALIVSHSAMKFKYHIIV